MYKNSAKKGLKAFVGTGVFVFVAMAPIARAELVYDSGNDPQAQVGAQVRADDRESTRKVLKSSQHNQPLQNGGGVQTVQIARRQPIQVIDQPQSAPASPIAFNQAGESAESEYQNNTKSELLRRQRMREELRNEDEIQERLESLRLRDEKKRTQQLFGTNGQSEDGAPMPPAPTAFQGSASASMPGQVPVQMTEEVVSVPVTERPGQPTVAPVAASRRTTSAQQAAMVAASSESVEFEQESGSRSRAQASASLDDEKTTVKIAPRVGLANMGGEGNLKVNSRYSAGLALSVDASDNMAFEVGYTFNEFGIELAQPGLYNPSPTGNYETRALKQNVIDAGLKFYLLGPSSKLRPFVGGGAAYSKSYLNYDQQYSQYLNQLSPQGQGVRDYEMSSYLGYLTTGFDVRISKSVSIGTLFKYYTVLSSRENASLPYQAFYGAQGNGLSSNYSLQNLSGTDAGNQYAGASLARSSFYSILAGVTFTF